MTSGTNTQGRFKSTRTAADTTTGIVIPVQTTGHAYPTAGMIVRSMTATVTFDGQTPTTSSRREVITYDGSSTAKVVLTQDGITHTCTLPLPRGKLACQ